MPKPRAVAKAAADAEKAHEAVYGKPGQPDPSGDPPKLESVPPATPPADPPAEPAAATPPADPPAEPAAPAAATPPADPPANTPKPEDTVEYWKHRYQTVEGKYNTEVPRLSAELRIMQGRLTDAQSTPAPAAPATPPVTDSVTPAHPATGQPLVSAEEIEEFGADTVDFVQRLVRQTTAGYEKQITDLKSQLDSRVGNIEQSAFDTARGGVFATLYEQVPNWEEINTDEDFVKRWLAEPDLYAGRPRGDLLKEAFEANDAPRVVAFFKGYLQEKGAVEQAPSPPTDPAPPARQPAVQMESLVAPGKPRGGTASTQEGETGRLWKESEINRFYRDVQRGVYKNNPDRKRQIEEDIIAASTTPGRIVPG